MSISFSSTIDGSGARALTLTAGTGGAVTMSGVVGGGTPLSSLTASGLSIAQGAALTATGAIAYTGTVSLGGNVTSTTPSTITMTGPVSLTGASIVSGSNLSFSSTINGLQALTLTGTGTVTMSGAVGAVAPLSSLTVSGTALTQGSTVQTVGAMSYTGTSIALNGNLTTSGGAIGFTGPVSLTSAVNASASGGNISFSSTIDGAQALALTGGAVTMSGAVGSTTPLNSLTASGTTIAQSSTVQTTGAISYTGAIALANNLTTSGGAVSMNGAVALSGPVVINVTNSASTGANISFTSTINNGQNLTLTAGSGGTVSLGGIVGGGTPLTALTATAATITQSFAVTTTGAINYTAPTLIAIGGSLTTTGSAIAITGPASVTGTVVATGSNITFSSTLNGGALVTLNGSGVVTLTGAVGGSTPLSSLSITAPTITQSSTVQTTGAVAYTGTASLAGNITTASGAVTVTGATTFGVNLTVDTTNGGASAAGANISFSSTLNGANTLNLLGGSAGNIAMTGAVGSTSLTATGASVTQGSTATTSGAISYTGAISLGGNLTTTSSPIGLTGPITLTGTVVATGSTISLSSTVDGAQSLTLSGSGAVTLPGAIGGGTPLSAFSATGSSVVQTGSISTTGAVSLTGALSIGANITTVNNNITLTGNVTRTNTNNVTLSTGAGVGSILVTGTLDGDVAGRNITLTGGTGTVTLQGTVGGVVPFNNFTVSGGTINLANRGTGASTSTGVTSVTATGAINFTGTIIGAGTQTYTAGTNFNFTSGSPTTISSGGLPITFVTGTIALSGGSDFTVNSNGGNVTLTNLTGVSRNIVVNAIGGTVNLAQIGTSGNNVQSVTVTGGVINHPSPIFSNTTPVFNSPSFLTITSNQIGPITYSSPVVIGADNLVFSGGSFTFSSTLNADSAMNSRNLTINPGSGNSALFNGLVGNSAALTSLTIGTASNVTFSAGVSVGSFTQTDGTGTTAFSGGLATTAAAGINIATNTVTISGSVSTGSGGGIVINNSGTFTSSGTAYLLSGSFQQTGSGATSLIGGNIQTSDALVSFAGPVSLTSAFTINTVSSTGAPITFSSTVDGAQVLSLTGTAITFTGAVGGTTPLASITATGTTITQSSSAQTTGAIAYTGTVSLGGNVTTSGSAITMTGPVTLTGAVAATGSAISFSSTINGANSLNVTGSGAVTLSGAVNISSLTVSAATITQSSTVKTTGAIAYTGLISLNGNQTTSGGAIHWTGPVTLTSAVAADTTNGGATPAGASITASSTINGAFGLTLTGGSSGTVSMSGIVGGSSSLASLTASGAAVTQSFSAQTTGAISYTGTTTLGGNLTTNGGPVSVTGATTLSGAVAVDTTNGGTIPAGASIAFSSTVDGAQNFTLASGGASIVLSGAVGSTTPVSAFAITTANNVTATAVSAVSFNQTTGSGTTTLNGAVTLSGASGFVFTGQNLTLNNTVTTALSGPATISVAGTFRLGTSGVMNLSGPFTASGAGMTQGAGSITTASNMIQFDVPLVLTGNTVLSTGAGAGNIIFTSTVDGPGGLSMTAGGGDITMSGAVGGSTRLGDFVIVSVADFMAANGIIATTITQTNGTGTSTFDGGLNTNGAGGIHKTGNNFIRQGALVTTNGGSLIVNNSGFLHVLGGFGASVSGAYEQIGTGPVTISANFSAASVSFNGAVTMSGPLTINSNNGSITFNSTIDATTSGVETLTLTAGTGNITISGAVGSNVQTGAFTVNSCTNATFSTIKANSVAVTESGGYVTFGGQVDVSGTAGIVLNVTSFERDAAFNITNGPYIVNFTGPIYAYTSDPITATSFHWTNVGEMGVLDFQGGAHATAGGITVDSAVNLIGTATFDSSAAGGNIVFNYPVNGANDLILVAGTGNITLPVIGGTTPIGNLTITSVNNLTASNISALTLTQTNGTGTSSFQSIATTGSGGINKTGNNFSRTGTLITTNGGSVVVDNSGTLTVTSGIGTSVSGSYSQTGTGAVSESGTISAAGISFNGPLTLNGNTTLISNNNDVTFSNTVDGTTANAQSLTITAGTGSITASAAIGGNVPIGALTVNSCANMSVQAMTVTSANITETGGTVHFFGNFNSTGSAGFMLTANNFIRGGGITVANGGPLIGVFTGTVTGGSPIPITAGSVSVTGGSLNTGGTVIATTGGITYNANLTLVANATLDSSLSGGNIVFNGSIDGGGTHNLTVTAGTGNVTFGGALGGNTAIDNLSVTGTAISLSNIGTATLSGISGTATLNASGAINLTGTNYFFNNQNYTTPAINLNAGALTTFTSADTPISFTTPAMSLSAGTNLTINSGGGSVTLSPLDGVSGDLQTVIVNAGAGTVNLSTIGTLAPSEFASVSITGGNINIAGNIVSNAVTFTPSGNTFLGANITTANNPLVFAGPVILNNVSTSTLTTSGGSVAFESTVDGDAANTRSLTLIAGTGSITFTGIVGGVEPLNALTIASANSVTASAAVNAADIVQLAGTGTTTFNGPVTTTGVLGISLTGTSFALNNTVTSAGPSSLSISDTGALTLGSSAVLNLSSFLTQTGTGSVNLAGSITAGGPVSFAGAVTLAGNASISTAAANQNIIFSNTVDGGNNLTLAAGIGNVIFDAAVGGTTRIGALTVSSAANITTRAVSAASINFTWTVGTFTFNGALNTNGVAGITLTGVNTVNNGSVTTTGSSPGDGPYTITTTGTTSGTPTGPTNIYGSITQSATGIGVLAGTFTSQTGNISTAHNVTLVGPVTVNTLSGGTVTLGGTVNGAFAVTVNSHGGTVLFNQPLGASTPLGAISIVGANSVTTQSIQAASISQTAGIGTTTFNGAITTTGASGISLATVAVTANAAITTENGGGFTLNNSGAFTTSSPISLSGAFNQTNGSGTASISGSITTTNANISFACPVTLTGAFIADTGTGTGSIAFGQTVQGAYDLTLDGNSGNITLSGDLGTTGTYLNSLTLASANSVSATGNIYAGTITQSLGLGTSTFNALNTNAAGGISLTGTSFAFNGAITTTAAGPFTVLSSSTASYNSGAIASIAGAFTQNGAATLSNSMTIGGLTQFLSAVTLSGSASVSTAAANQNISFASTIDGGGNLTLAAGSGTINLTGAVGGGTRIGNLVISSVFNLNANNITASTITQTAGSGTSTFQNLNTNGAGGIHKVGNNFVRTGTLVTTNGGSLYVDNSGTLTVGAGSGATVSGSYMQAGTGTEYASGTLTASGISFAGALVLNGNLTLISNNDAISFTTVDATTAGVQNLTLTAGTGDITFADAVGGVTPIGVFTINSCTNLTVQAINAASINFTETGGAAHLLGDINTTAPAGILFHFNDIQRTGSITAVGGGGLTSISTGNVLVGSIAAPITAGFVTLSKASGILNFQGSATATSGSITFNAITNLVGTTTLDSSQSGGDILLSGTVNGAHGLILNAGAGNVVFEGIVGGGIPLGALSIESAGSVTSLAISATSISALDVTGFADFGGALTTTGSSGISIAADAIAFGGNITTSIPGPLSLDLVDASSLTIPSGTAISLGGAFSQTGTGTVSIGGSLAANGDISFASPIALNGELTLDSSSGNGDITLSSTVDGAEALTLNAGSGDIIAEEAIGGTTRIGAFTVDGCTNLTLQAVNAASINVTETGGLATFNGTLNTNGSSGIALDVNNVLRGGGFIATGGGGFTGHFTGTVTVEAPGGPLTAGFISVTKLSGNLNFQGTATATSGGITFNTTVNLIGPATFNSSAAGGDIVLSGTVDGAQPLTLNPGTGSITLMGDLGDTTPLGAISIVSATDVSTRAISAASIAGSSITGLVTFGGAVTTSGAAGISLSTNQLTADSTITTQNSGPISLVHTGALTLPFGSSISSNGTFTESGGGAVTLGANVSTASGTISWSSPITLSHDVTMNSGAGVGNIVFNNTAFGLYCLTLNAGLGNVQIAGALNLNCLSASGASILQTASITTASTVALTGAVSLGANITTTGSDITITGNVLRTTTNNVTLSTGVGAGDILVTGTVNGNIAGRNLTLTTGTGSVTLAGTLGGTIPINNLSISAANVSLANRGTTNSGSTGTTTVTATDAITFTGTNVFAGTQTYTAANFNFTSGTLTTLSSSGQPIVFATGPMALGTNTNLTINSNGGDVTLTDLTGPSQTLTIDAISGTITGTNIGTSLQPLNAVNFTASSYMLSGTSYPAVNYTPTTVTSLSGMIMGDNTYGPVTITGDTTFSNGTFTFTSTVNGAYPIVINPGPGNSVVFSGLVGNSTPPTSVTIGAGQDLTVSGSITTGSFTQTDGTGTTTISNGITANDGGISIGTMNITIAGSTMTTNNAPLVLDNSGLLTVTDAVFNLDGAFEQTGSGNVSIGGNIQTTDDGVSFTGAVALTNDLTINTVDMSGGPISFGSTVDQPYNLNLTAGSSPITFGDVVGGMAPVGNVTIESASDVNVDAAMSAASITQVAGTGTTTFSGAVNTSTADGIQLAGHAFAIDSSVTTANGGSLTIAETGGLALGASADLSVGGAITQTGSGAVSLSGAIAAGGNISFASAATLANPTVFSTPANITLSSTLGGSGSVEFNAGNLLLSGAVSTTGAFTIDNANNVTAQGIAAATITQTAGTGTTTLGSLNTSGAGGISLTTAALAINGNLITTGSGPVAISNSGVLTLAAGSSTSISGAFTQSGGGSTSLSGTLLTTGGAISFANPINLTAATAISNSSGSGNLTFSSPINGTQNLTLTAGTGNLLFSSSVGNTNRLSALTVQSAANVTYQAVSAASINQQGSSGTTLISGALNTSGSSGISLTGGAINQNATLTTTNSGPVAIVNTGAFTQGANITASGGFSQSGGGAVSLNGTIATTSAPISIGSAATLAGATTLSTGGSGPGNIAVSGTVDGNNNLTFTAGTGTITLSQPIGGTTPIGILTINSAGTVNAGAINAASIAQIAGTGVTTFNGSLSTTGTAGIALTGSGFTINNSVATTTGSSGANLTVTNSGSFTLGSSANLSLAGQLIQNGSGSSSLQGTIATGGSVSFQSAVSVPTSGSASIDSSANNQPIQFSSAVSGPGALTLTLGSGNLTFGSSVSSLSSLNIASAGTVTTNAITAGSIAASSSSATFGGDLTATGGSGISLSGGAITLTGNATSAGPLTIVNTGLLTTSLIKTLSSTGSFSQSGGGAVSLGGTVQTANQALSFASPITLIGTTALNSGSGAGSITLSSTVDGAQNLTLTAGTGNINVAGAMGGSTRLGNVIVVSAQNDTFSSIFASSFTQQALSNQFTLIGTFNTNGPGGISLTGNNFFRQGALVTTNGGNLTFLNTGAVTGAPGNTANISGAWIQLPGSTGTVNLGGTIVANGGFTIIGPFSLVGDATLDASAGTGGISIANTVNGAHAFTLIGGNGNISITQPLGGTTALNSLTVTGNNIALANVGGALVGVTGATSVTSSGGIITLNGTIYNGNAQTYNATQFNLSAGSTTTISSNGSALNFQTGTLTLAAGTNVVMNTANGPLTTASIRAGSSSGRSVTLSSGTGNIQVGSIGLAGDGEFASASLSGANITLGGNLIAAAITLAPTGTLNVGGNITTTATPLSFPTAVVLNNNSTISTGAGGNITFNGTINGASADTQNLTLAAGTGNIAFNAAVGSTATSRPNLVTISSAATVSIGNLAADGFIQSAGTVTTTISGTVSIVNNQGFQFTGAGFTLLNTGSIQTAAGSSVNIKNSAISAIAGTINPDGSFLQTGTGQTNFLGSIATNQGGVSFTGPVVLSGNPSLNSSANNQPISFAGALSGGGNLTLTAGTGAIAFPANATSLGAITIPSAGNISVQNFACSSLSATSTGTMSFVGNLSSSGSSGIALIGVDVTQSGTITTTGGGNFVLTNSGTFIGASGNTATIDGSYTQNGTGPVKFAGTVTTNNQNISFASPITLLATTALNTGSGSGDILLSNTVDGASPLTLAAGGGNITLSGALGSSTPLGNISISSAALVSAQAITAASITQVAGSNTSTFNGAITTSGSLGINLTGTNIIQSANWIATGAGGITVDNSGTFTSPAGNAVQSAGAFNQSGTGPVLIGGTVLTSNSAISFAGSITLTAGLTLNSGSGAGNISLTNSVNGAQNLTFNSGTGTISSTSSIGASTPINILTISQSGGGTFNSIRAASILQSAGTGTMTFAGTVNTSAIAGISLAGAGFTFSGAVTTAASGPITISNTALFTLSAPCSSSGSFNQTGSGTSTLNSSINSGGLIRFLGPVNTTGTGSLVTSSNPITLSSTLDGPGNISFNAGAAAISLQAVSGSLHSLGALTFVQATDISTLGITASSIAQINGTGTTTMVGNLNTTGASGIQLTGTNFAITSTINTTNMGPMTVAHTGLFSLNAGNATLLTGPFTESGVGGTVNLAGNLHAGNANISFANPITLTGAATLNSDGGGDILITSTIDGPQTLVYTAGTGNITIEAAIGSITPVTSLTITSAQDVSTEAISAGSIAQTAGTGTSTFNGALITTLPAGIQLTGRAFTFDAPVTTGGTGVFVINNSSTLTLPNTAPITLGGNFRQTGAGGVLLGTTVEAAGSQLLFTGPITLTGASLLDISGTSGTLTLSSTVNGDYNLTLDALTGSIVLSGAVGGSTPLATFQVTECTNFTSGAISASEIDLANIAGLATFNGAMNASEISLSGAAFTLNANVTSGALTIHNTSLTTISPTITLSLTGPFTQTGSGTTNMGGALLSHGNNISFSGPILLTGDLTLTSANGNITFGSDVEGAHSLTITAGTGDVTAPNAFSLATPLQNFTIVSAHDISLNGIGSLTSIMSGAITLAASDVITLNNTTYVAHSQSYTAAVETNLTNTGLVTFTTNGGPITFAGGPVQLDTSTDISVVTGGGEFSFATIEGTAFENITIATGSGLASLGSVTNSINSIQVTAGSILFNQPMDIDNGTFIANSTILNAGASVDITSLNTVFLNTINGNIGTDSSPISVDTSAQIISGACSFCTVYLLNNNESVSDETVQVYAPNPPCVIYFNGVMIKDCGITPPTPPPPPPGPTPKPVVSKGHNLFAFIWVYDSQFNLASDYFFFPYFLDEKYWLRPIPVFVRGKKYAAHD